MTIVTQLDSTAFSVPSLADYPRTVACRVTREANRLKAIPDSDSADLLTAMRDRVCLPGSPQS